jgi:hypothetical protein
LTQRLRRCTGGGRLRGKVISFSDVTLWRWRRLGWIKTVNISGKVYVDLESLADFNRHAAAGEFARHERSFLMLVKDTFLAKKGSQMVNHQAPVLRRKLRVQVLLTQP